ncbi:lectin-like domain-containing protein [Levilactobacillus yiduensis]|uniref:lectin-like domain-containing protein n=1 Tax=Levilactobacillus yiduensis TaxID=2953880 RepID=UPI000EF2F4E6|nr:hypothetical protein [Levilactobacillus yiduensis]AYM03654.1 hypothetical protein D8911_11910 [Levilactobacillus brevis]
MKKGIVTAAITLATAGLGLWSSIPADAAEPRYYNYQDALTGAPQGVDLNSSEYSGYFWNGDNGVEANGTNKAEIVNAGSTTNSAIKISQAGEKNSWGAIWSRDAVFDLAKPERTGMWIYTSTEQAFVNQGLGDGMAFVLQNSTQGVKAFSKSTALDKDKNTVITPGVGESMGVWGMDPQSWQKMDLGQNAIDRSWALEFDTHRNQEDPLKLVQWDLNDTYPSSFDNGNYYNQFDSSGDATGAAGTISSSNNHIASNYPGSASTYTAVGAAGLKTNIWATNLLGATTWYPTLFSSDYRGTYYFYKMTHLGYLDEGKNADATTDKMTDHRWHHVTLTYTPPTNGTNIGKMRYVYDDKNSDTGQPKQPANEATVPLKLDEFKLENGSTKVRWGFTGSTGESTENNLVVFDQVPGDVVNSATATLSIQDNDSNDYTPVDTSSTPTISGGMPVKLAYTFKRSGGSKDWEEVNAALNIPNSITLTSGSIENPDGSRAEVDISKRDGTTLPVNLGSDGNGLTLTGSDEAKITLYGTVGADAATEAEATSYFNGSNASAAASLPAFNVKASNLKMTISPEDSTLNVADGSGQPAQIVGQAKYPYGLDAGAAAMKPEDIIVHLVVNHVDQGSKALTDILAMPGVDPWVFSYPVDDSLLKRGVNTIELYSTNKSSEERSNTDSVDVTTSGYGFGSTSGPLVFQPTVLSGSATVIKRSAKWALAVVDSRQKAGWQLVARTAGMTLNDNTAVKTPLDGQLIYVDSDGTQHPLSNDMSTLIATGQATGDDTETDIAADWSDDQGILLKINGSAMQGNYSGEIDWELTNVPS